MSNIKEILCLHHSHLDVGYTHPQHMLLELQCDYIDQAIDLCLATADLPEESRFSWTCEASYPLTKWMETAPAERIHIFRKLAEEGRISVAAMPMHTTPGCTAMQLTQMLQNLDEIRAASGCPIRTAINHDINGQPWTLAPLLLDSNVSFYITGINIHMGGVPFPRPYLFRWETPDGRLLPTLVGEHYSLFSQFLSTDQNSTVKMHEGVQKYIARMEQSGWQEDYLYLTATNPPLLDNNCPDANIADLIRRYNAEGHEQVIRFVTPEQLYDRILQKGLDNLPIHRGDWTDYWNFGCASTARETKISRRAKTLLHKADFLECFSKEKPSAHYQEVQHRAYQNAMLFDEHTWGASESVVKPDQEETYAQEIHKKEYAYTAADTAAYLLSCQMEHLAGNPCQSDGQEGVCVVNPTGFTVQQELHLPSYMTKPGRTLSALRAKMYLPYEQNEPDTVYCGHVQIPPYSVRRIPFTTLQKKSECNSCCTVTDKEIVTPYYRVTLLPNTGRIKQIEDLATHRMLLDTESEWGLFDLVEEHIDPRFAPIHRSSIFPRDIELGNRSISQWQRGWHAVRESISELTEWHVEQNTHTVTLIYHSRARNISWMEQRITFSTHHARIGLDAVFQKNPVSDPEGLYFAFPLQLNQGWQCVYDTADTFVKLDEEQLGAVCRDWLTVDKSVSLFDKDGGVTLACPDAPMVQVGGFQFGRENKEIRRDKNPLLLAWPLNNYWDTNFAISQSGKITFHYELQAFAQFHAENAYEAGLLATNPCSVGAAITCAEDECEQLFDCKGNNATVLFFRPALDGEGFLAAVKNHSDKKTACTLSMPGHDLAAASITDIQGKTKCQLKPRNGCVQTELAPQSITFVLICPVE